MIAAKNLHDSFSGERIPGNPIALAAGATVSDENRVPRTFSVIEYHSGNFPKTKTERVEPAAAVAAT